MTFTDFLNKTQMTSLSAFNSQIVWMLGSVALTIADYQLLVWGTTAARESGLILSGMLLGAWTGKSVVNAVSNYGNRTSSREYMAGQAKVAEAQATGPSPTTLQVNSDQANVQQETAPGGGG